jgi:GNAT superfamily N-acetyltransferase
VASAAETAEKGSFCPVTADPSTDGEGEVWGTFALIEDGEPTYGRIYDGQWLTPDQDGTGHPAYLAIHRVAISVVNRGSGISTRLLEYAADTARANGFKSLRIDTHRGNVVMRRMLEKHGFVHCGTIHLQNGDPRVAYERLL